VRNSGAFQNLYIRRSLYSFYSAERTLARLQAVAANFKLYICALLLVVFRLGPVQKVVGGFGSW
jgi:hypothetical protein